MRISFLKIYYSRVIKKIIGLPTPQQKLLDKFERLLNKISNQYVNKGLNREDAYQQAYLELLETYLQYPEITDRKLINKVYDNIRTYYRREINYRSKKTSLDFILDGDDDEDDENLSKLDIFINKKYSHYYHQINQTDRLEIEADQLTRTEINKSLFDLNLIQKTVINKAFDILGSREKQIIKMYFFLGYREEEIATYFKVSQQRINLIKNKALMKMSNTLLENDLQISI